MFRTGFVWRFLLTLLLIGVLAAGGAALYRAGWVQGYQAGILAASGSEVAPSLPFYYPYPGFGFWPFFAPFGLFAWIGIFFLVFFLLGGLFRFWGWQRWRGNWEHGHTPPWAREWQERHKGEREERGGTSGTQG